MRLRAAARSSARRWTSSTCGSTPAQAGTPCSNTSPSCACPADLYIEGGDQHRGWFHSSLLTSVAVCGNARRIAMVATSGWTLDEQGRALSKSLGNGVDPVDIAKRLGGEIVRLWVASVDFREDVAASENLMQRVSRELPQAAQHVPLPARQPARLRPGAARSRMGEARAARPVHARPHARARPPKSCAGTRTSSSTASITRSTNSRTSTSARSTRRAQRPPLHLRAQQPRAPQRADRALADHRSARPPGRAHPQLHRRRGLAVSARG